MSLDKLIAAATDYFTTGADVHRRALAGGGGKITDLSDTGATKKVAAKAKKSEDTVEQKTEASEKEHADYRAAEAKRLEEEAAANEAIEEATAKAQTRDDTAADDLDGARALSYEEDIRPLLRAKSLANRDALVALLGTFNVKSGAELEACQYPSFFEQLQVL